MPPDPSRSLPLRRSFRKLVSIYPNPRLNRGCVKQNIALYPSWAVSRISILTFIRSRQTVVISALKEFIHTFKLIEDANLGQLEM